MSEKLIEPTENNQPLTLIEKLAIEAALALREAEITRDEQADAEAEYLAVRRANLQK